MPYTLVEKKGNFYFQGAKIHGRDVSQIPYRKCRKVLSIFLRHCEERMLVFVPITTSPLEDAGHRASVDDITIVHCDKCGIIQPRYLLDGFA